jgi:hypothetical protein
LWANSVLGYSTRLSIGPMPVAGQRARLFADVVLAVGAAVGAEAEQLHHLAGVVLVRRALHVFVAVQPLQHRRVDRHRLEQVEERAEAVGAEEVRLIDHLLGFGDAAFGGREPVVEDERHPLDQRLVGADHAIQPPEVVVTPDVGGGDRVAVFFGRRRAREDGAAARPGQRLDRGDQADRGERGGLAGGGAEARAGQQAGRLGDAEGARVGTGRALFAGRRGRRGVALLPHRRLRPRAAEVMLRRFVFVVEDVALDAPVAVRRFHPAPVLVVPGAVVLLVMALVGLLAPAARLVGTMLPARLGRGELSLRGGDLGDRHGRAEHARLLPLSSART